MACSKRTSRGPYSILFAAALIAGSSRSLAQFQSAAVSVLAQSSSHLETDYGTDDRMQTAGTGAYPQFLGSANADQVSGPSGVQVRSEVGLELTESGLSASGSFFLSISVQEGFQSAAVSALSRVWVDFSIGTARTWKIDPGTTTGPSGNTLVTLEHESTQVFLYSGEFGGASGQLEPGDYRLAITASAEIETTGTSNETGGTYSVGFTLGTVNPCPADLNGDSFVDDFDFLIFLPAYDTLACDDPEMPQGCPADLNGDGVVEDADFSIFIVAYDALICPTNR